MQKILAKLHAVMMDVKYIQKDKKNAFHSYKYASELAIKTDLGIAFRKHKIVFQLNTTEASISESMGTDGKDKEIRATILKCNYVFYDVESGEKLEGEFMASGPARDDKGLWAATTNAIKYILTSTFLIPTGDDAESDRNHPAEEKPGKKTTNKKAADKKAADKKAEPPENELDQAMGDRKTIDHKATFTITFTQRCKEQNLAIDNNVKMIAFGALYASPLIPQVCKTTGYDIPVANMPPEHTGWLVLNQIVKTFNVEAAVQKAMTESDM